MKKISTFGAFLCWNVENNPYRTNVRRGFFSTFRLELHPNLKIFNKLYE